MEKELNDVDYLALIYYLRRNYKEALEKWAWKGSTTMHRLTEIKESIENGESLKETIKDYIQRVLSHCEKRKIQEWMETPAYQEYCQFAKQGLVAKQENRELTKVLKGKVIPVKFKNTDRFGNMIGWISFQGIDETLPIDIRKKLFILPKELVPPGFETGLIYNTSVIGVTNGGAIRVKTI